MRALTILQPYAWAIAAGYKLVENRTWHPVPGDGFRLGDRIAIHAGKEWHERFSEGTAEPGVDRFTRLEHAHGGPLPPDVNVPDDFDRGAIIAVARVVSFVAVPNKLSAEQRRWFEGPWGWVLEDVRRVTPAVEARGALGFWHVSAPTTELVLGRMEERDGGRRHG